MLRFCFVLTVLVLTGCAGKHPMAPNSIHHQSYRLNTGDTIRLNVFDEPDLSGNYTLDGEGMAALPLIGKIDITSRTEIEAAETIAALLKEKGYLKNPKVAIEIVSMRPVYVMGEVENSGSFAYLNGLTVNQAIASAGGYTYRADRGDITLRRKAKNVGEGESIFFAKENTPLLPGDVIEVGERFF